MFGTILLSYCEEKFLCDIILLDSKAQTLMIHQYHTLGLTIHLITMSLVSKIATKSAKEKIRSYVCSKDQYKINAERKIVT